MRVSTPRLRAVSGVLLASLLIAGSALQADDKPPAVTHDGLHLVPDSEVAAAWVKPGADFSGYDKVMLLEPHVAFKKNWQREQNRGSLHQVTKHDMEKMKQGMAKLFRETFVEVLGEKDGYAVVEAADADVLLLRPAIVDLDVTAPDLQKAGRSYNFAASAGAATLYLELYDSVSGEILGRAIDRKAANHPGDFMRWTNKVTNRAEARKLLAQWAGLLRDSLDEIHGKGGE